MKLNTAVVEVWQRGCEERRQSSTIVIFKENRNGEGADFVLCACGEGRVDGAHDAQRLHDEGEHLGAELGGQLDQSLQDAGEERLQDMGALRQLQLITVSGEWQQTSMNIMHLPNIVRLPTLSNS